ncbi:MAG: hypothetical protein AAGD04_12765 [Pseudomonadota bacterium]
MAQNVEAPLAGVDWLKQALESPSLSTGALPEDRGLSNGQTYQRNLVKRPPAPTQSSLAPNPQSASATLSPSVDTKPIAATIGPAFGLMSAQTSGLPTTLWENSRETALIDILQRTEWPSLPALQSLMQRLLLTEATPPAFASTASGTTWTAARARFLADQGGVYQAQAFLEARAGPSPSLAPVILEIALYTGDGQAVCERFPASYFAALPLDKRLYCQMRKGDWEVAGLSLAAAEALGSLEPETAQLLWAFLEPELAEALLDSDIQAEPINTETGAPKAPNPLRTALSRDIGLPLNAARLPLAYAVADLDGQNGWKAEVETALRLSRAGLLPDNQLLAILTAREPAASGRLWDNLAAWQIFDEALTRQNPMAVEETLPLALAAARVLGVSAAFARLYGDRTQALPLEGEAGQLQTQLLLLTQRFEAAGPALLSETDQNKSLRAAIEGRAVSNTSGSPRAAAISSGFADTELPAKFSRLVDNNRAGEALLAAVSLINEGWWGDTRSLQDGLRLLRRLDLETDARQIAVQLLILDPPA